MVEQREENKQVTHPEWDARERGRDPMDFGGGGPTEPGEAEHDAGAPEARKREAAILLDGGQGVGAGFETLQENEEEGAGDACAEANGKEGEAERPGVML